MLDILHKSVPKYLYNDVNIYKLIRYDAQIWNIISLTNYIKNTLDNIDEITKENIKYKHNELNINIEWNINFNKIQLFYDYITNEFVIIFSQSDNHIINKEIELIYKQFV